MPVNLCIDWGNTNIKVAIYDQDRLVTRQIIDSDKVKENFSALLEKYSPSNSILCSVTDHNNEIESLLAERTKFFILLDGYTKLPIHNAYYSNDTIGPDRLELVTAGHLLNPDKNNLIVCLGTCVTYNFITKNKTFRGGAISPGMRMRLKAMHQLTDRLPDVDADGELLLLGYDTATCMRSGAIFGMAAEIDGMVAEYQRTYPDFNAILTGGDAPFFANKLKCKIFADPDLILKGLNLIVNHNVQFSR